MKIPVQTKIKGMLIFFSFLLMISDVHADSQMESVYPGPEASGQDNMMYQAEEIGVQVIIDSDEYEDDDAFSRANVIVLGRRNSEVGGVIGIDYQIHNFHDAGDQDWVKFLGIKDEKYSVGSKYEGSNVDVVFELFDTDGTTQLILEDPLPSDRDNVNYDVEKVWTCPEDGLYFVKATHANPGISGDNTEYTLEMWKGGVSILTLLTGNITDSSTGQPIKGARVKSSQSYSALSFSTGDYLMYHPEGENVQITATANGYGSSGTSVSIGDGVDTIRRDFSIQPVATDGQLSDLIVKSVSKPPRRKKRGKKFTIKEQTRNVGEVSSGRSKTCYYLSKNKRKDGKDKKLKCRTVSALSPGKVSKKKIKVKIPKSTKPRKYYLLACADAKNKVAESSEKNNCRAARRKIKVKR